MRLLAALPFLLAAACAFGQTLTLTGRISEVRTPAPVSVCAACVKGAKVTVRVSLTKPEGDYLHVFALSKAHGNALTITIGEQSWSTDFSEVIGAGSIVPTFADGSGINTWEFGKEDKTVGVHTLLFAEGVSSPVMWLNLDTAKAPENAFWLRSARGSPAPYRLGVRLDNIAASCETQVAGLLDWFAGQECPEMVIFFRGVSEKEAAQIKRTQTLETIPEAGEVKYLTNSRQAAATWGLKLNGPSYRVVEVRVPKSDAEKFTYLGRIDGIGEAWTATPAELRNARVRVLP